MSFGSETPAGHFGSVDGSPPGGPSSGISLVTSSDGSIIVGTPAGPTVDLKVATPAVPGVTSFNTLTGAVLYHPIINVATVAALAAISATAANGYDTGSRAYVQTLGDDWELQQSALSVDNITTVNANGRAGFQWVRMLQPNPANATVAIWSVDPTNGNDESAGTGASAAAADLVALKTLQEVKRRLWGLTINQAVSVRVLNSCTSTDIGVWNTAFIGTRILTIQGILGVSTGPGGVTNNNTLYSGTVSAVAVPAMGPTADDYELTDSTIPASFTASGLLASGILFRRSNGTAVSWYALKDLGSKTIRITFPLVDAGTTGTFTIGDTYSAYQLPKVFQQSFPGWAQSIAYNAIDDEAAASLSAANFPGQAVRRTRSWIGANSFGLIINLMSNCLVSVPGTPSITGAPFGNGLPQFQGGGLRGDGTSASAITLFGKVAFFTFVQCQGVSFTINDYGQASAEESMAFYDNTVTCIEALGGGTFSVQTLTAGAGISGKGNTGKLAAVNKSFGGVSSISYSSNSATPPWNAASSSDAAPIQLGAKTYAVASLPVYSPTMLNASVLPFPVTGVAGVMTIDGTTRVVGFFSAAGAGVTQQTGGAATAGVVYTATEQAMLNNIYTALRAYGLLT